MNFKKTLKFSVITTALLLTSLTSYAASYSYETNHYDHATVGQHFDRHAMVTEWVGGHYNRSEKTNVYDFKYADGTICRVLVSQYGIVLRIIIVKP